MTKKVYSLDTKPGIQRDGTVLDFNFYTNGQWVRFQRGRPRKIGGYREIANNIAGVSRGIFVNPVNNFNAIFSGYNNGLQEVLVDNNGTGAGVTQLTLSNFTSSDNNLWQFDTFTDTYGSGVNQLLAHPGQNLTYIDNTVNTPVLGGNISGTTFSAIGTFTDTITGAGTTSVTIAAANPLIGPGQAVTGTGIPANTTVVSVVSTTVTMNNVIPAGAVVATFNNNISVSGGVVTLHPYVFAYGNNGLIKNCASGNLQDWVSAEANEVNVATGKIVKALPVRGGSNSPSGLFWSLDSLIRVSFAPTTVTVGATQVTQYWRYDIITSQTSIMSSQCVIEYDGVYYWVATDRFMMYNGVAKEIPNNFNQNHFFDNLNYNQRQKVWATKVPRFGEVWWYYPRGDSTECNDAIIFNIRENCWYDAGTAEGARRSAGYFSQVFRYPVAADWAPNDVGGVATTTITNQGTLYTNGTYAYKPLTGGSGTGATATIVVSGNKVTSVTIQDQGVNYAVGDTLSVLAANVGGTGSGFVLTINTTTTFTSLWQHEIGTDAVKGTYSLAITSFFETNDLGWISGGPSDPAMVGENRWLDIERIEPDFIMTGEMNLYIYSRPYAQADDNVSNPYPFTADTHKIDMREQGRQLRIRCTSNVSGGNYQLGKMLINGTFGDVRGY